MNDYDRIELVARLQGYSMEEYVTIMQSELDSLRAENKSLKKENGELHQENDALYKNWKYAARGHEE